MACPRPATAHQPCDTFFVESDDLHPRMDPKEQARLIARERQYAIADQLSNLAKEEYLDDCLSHMLHMDVRIFYYSLEFTPLLTL
jgi:hypothetical protein